MPQHYDSLTGKTFNTTYYSDANKKLGLPRVSEISKYAPKGEGLEIWQATNVATEAIKQIRLGKTDEEVLAIAKGASKKALMKAAEEGELIHKLVEDISNHDVFSKAVATFGEDIVLNLGSEYVKWNAAVLKEGWKFKGQETVVIDTTVGYGGRLDRVYEMGERNLWVDFKSKDIGSRARLTAKGTLESSYYQDAWIAQLAAYASQNKGQPSPLDQFRSVIIDRLTGKFYWYEWSYAEALWGWDCFKAYHNAHCVTHHIDIKDILIALNNKKLCKN